MSAVLKAEFFGTCRKSLPDAFQVVTMRIPQNFTNYASFTYLTLSVIVEKLKKLALVTQLVRAKLSSSSNQVTRLPLVVVKAA